MEYFTCDVLVVGSGAAGLRAAIAAREKGMNVYVISKGPRGKRTSTVLSGGVFAGSQEHRSMERHLASTLKAGRGINQKELVEVLVEDAPIRLRELAQWGYKAEFHNDWFYSTGRAHMGGAEVIRCLIEKNNDLGTNFLDGIVVVKLVCQARSAGVIGYKIESGKWMTISTKAIVIATGGAGALYFRHDNPRRMLGDGYILALEAGAVLQNMEFVQFYPLGLAEPGLPPFLIDPFLADCGRLINGLGEEILEKYNIRERPAGIRSRDRLSQALFVEIYRNNEEVHLDLTKISEYDWHRNPYSSSTKSILGERYGAKHRAVRIAPIAHFFLGGVRIDADAATSVPGLFAAGEVTGGVHGANRMGGNALTETLVYGKRAGEAAAAWAKDNDAMHGKLIADKLKDFLQNLSGDKEKINPVQLTEQLQKVMWTDGGILRNKHGLSRALETVNDIQAQAVNASLGTNPSEVQRILELRFAAKTASLILQSAIIREESRGAHFREDFPDQDDKSFRGSIQVQFDTIGFNLFHINDKS